MCPGLLQQVISGHQSNHTNAAVLRPEIFLKAGNRNTTTEVLYCLNEIGRGGNITITFVGELDYALSCFLPLKKSILETADIDHRGIRKGLRQSRVLLKDRLHSSERETNIFLSTHTNTMLEDTLESSKPLCFMRTANTSQPDRRVCGGVSQTSKPPSILNDR